MDRCSAGYAIRLALRLLLVTAALLLTVNSYSAVLNPFPKLERAPVYQQVAPRYQQPGVSPELEQFRKDISRFPCSDLDTLTKRIEQQFNEADTVADREYYQNFLMALRDEKTRRCNK